MNTAKKKSVFAVCDTEMEYARNFMEYLNQKRNIPFEVHAFSSAEMFLEFAKNNETEILLISDKAMKEEIRRYPIRQIIILSEGVHSPVLDQYPAVYKYQSSEKVIREVMACYGVENGVDTSPALLPKKEMRIIGIYSPVGRTQKTSFALTMGQILAKERAVLYLNMESYSGFERLLECSYDRGMSDILYYARQENQGIIYKLGGMVQSMQNLDYLPPAASPMDIQTAKYEEWKWLFQEIEKNSSYEVLILDLGDGVADLYQILDFCNEIYVPIRNDVISAAKMEQFENLLRRWDCQSVLDKMRKIHVPFHTANRTGKAYFEELVWSELGDYVRQILRRKLMERIDIASEPDDGEVLEEIDGLILGEEETRYLPVAQKAELRRQLFYSVRRLDVLQELLEDAGITEIMVNGYQHIFVERNGRIERYGKSFTSAEKLEDVIQQIVGRCNRVVNEQNPIVDARLENGDRVNVVMKPVALNGPILTIRRFPEQAVTMEFLVSIGSITKEAAEFLQALVRTRYSMMIGGATGSGKTTFLNVLSAYIPKGERIITIEDNAELQIQGVENLVRLEAKEANLESGTEITIRDLIRAALRMRPKPNIIK